MLFATTTKPIITIMLHYFPQRQNMPFKPSKPKPKAPQQYYILRISENTQKLFAQSCNLKHISEQRSSGLLHCITSQEIKMVHKQKEKFKSPPRHKGCSTHRLLDDVKQKRIKWFLNITQHCTKNETKHPVPLMSLENVLVEIRDIWVCTTFIRISYCNSW